jgi:hypothetical protein
MGRLAAVMGSSEFKFGAGADILAFVKQFHGRPSRSA